MNIEILTDARDTTELLLGQLERLKTQVGFNRDERDVLNMHITALLLLGLSLDGLFFRVDNGELSERSSTNHVGDIVISHVPIPQGFKPIINR